MTCCRDEWQYTRETLERKAESIGRIKSTESVLARTFHIACSKRYIETSLRTLALHQANGFAEYDDKIARMLAIIKDLST